MRDDIHKSAPVNRAWRQYVKRVARKADRDDCAREYAERALVGDCRREIAPFAVQRILERCDGPSRELFGSKLDGLDTSKAHVLEKELVSRLRLAERAAPLDRNSFERVLTGLIADRADDQARAIKGHILKEGGGGKDVADCLRAINDQISSLPAAAYAKALMANSLESGTGSITGPVDLDEDLR